MARVANPALHDRIRAFQEDVMPIKHAALRQMRKDRVRHQRNQAVRSELRTLTKRLRGLLEGNKLDEARTLIRLVTSRYDRAVSRGVVHRNTAARTKSRLLQRLNRRASGI
jgi:small subunit ribosomal protein S20